MSFGKPKFESQPERSALEQEPFHDYRQIHSLASSHSNGRHTCVDLATEEGDLVTEEGDQLCQHGCSRIGPLAMLTGTEEKQCSDESWHAGRQRRTIPY